MNVDIANALSGYIETLYYLNKKLIKLCGLDIMSSNECGDKEILDIIQEIPRIIPYSASSEKSERPKIKLIFKNGDGLLEYCDNLKYLKKDYNCILKDNDEFLDKIRRIRNKYEHKMHGAKYLSSGNFSFVLFAFAFQIGTEIIEVNDSAFIKLIKQLNTLFSNLVKDIRKYACENGKETYPYYRRITRFDFEDFNLLYESDLLKKIGSVMQEF